MKLRILTLFLLLSTLNLFAGGDGKITLEKIWKNGTFSSRSVHGINSMNDGQHYSVLEDKEHIQQINKYSYERGEFIETILENTLKTDAGNDLKIEDYSFSKNEKLILITTESERIYRHSMRSSYYLYDLLNKKLQRVGNSKFQLAEFSPDGKYISYVKDNNLFVFDHASKKEIAITNDGVINMIINGAPDWVYEEEFALVKGYEWSYDSRSLAYYRFDESNVKEYSFPVYGSLYPENYVYKYPKAGEANAVVEIKIYNFDTENTVDVQGVKKFEYVPRIQWVPSNGKLSVQYMNRLQNEVSVELVDRYTGTSEVLLVESSRTYLNVQDIIFMKKSSGYLWQSERTGNNQIYYYEIGQKMELNSVDGSDNVLWSKNAVTEGNEVVLNIVGINEENNKICYEYTNESSIIEKFVRIAPILKKDGIEGEWFEFSIGQGLTFIQPTNELSYFIAYHSGASSVPKVSVLNSRGEIIRNLEENTALSDTLSNYKLGRKEFFRFKNSDGVELMGWMLKPADFDPKKKYPLFMYVYGGPGSQTVTNTWGGSNDMWFQYLAQNGYIVASIDNRGTGARSRNFRDCTYGQLGQLETQDQISGAKFLGNKEFIDEKRIGIWGWSYGGYMSTLCLAKGANVFKMAIAVAPVTNWRYYDSIYTERYMGLPSENGEAYDSNSPINHVDKIKGSYLLVHGTADDNVHFQNTTELIDVLVKKNIQFDLAVYPNKNHGIYGGNTRFHLYTKMTNFIFENL